MQAGLLPWSTGSLSENCRKHLPRRQGGEGDAREHLGENQEKWPFLQLAALGHSTPWLDSTAEFKTSSWASAAPRAPGLQTEMRRATASELTSSAQQGAGARRELAATTAQGQEFFCPPGLGLMGTGGRGAQERCCLPPDLGQE